MSSKFYVRVKRSSHLHILSKSEVSSVDKKKYLFSFTWTVELKTLK